MRKTLLLSLFFIYGICSKNMAQTPKSMSSSEILLGLQKLNVLGSVLYVGAHPDDENTRLLTYLAKDKKYRAAYLSLTRGDGGQNLIGDEQGITLGLIRTQELLAARRIDGAEQFFSTAYDFGYSKNPEETFTIWNKEKILGDVVWVIRKFQPDVIITRFPEDGRAGHGHHSGSAILAREAFAAAADPARFPEQFGKGVKVWQAKRVLWNTFNFGGNNQTAPDQFKIDVGTYSPVLGRSVGEIAGESRSQHKTQGFGSAEVRGQLFEFFSPVAGPAPVNDLLDDVDATWKRTGNDTVTNWVNNIIKSFDATQPEKSIEQLGALKDYLMQRVNNSYWVVQKIKEIEVLISACAGFYAEALASQQLAVSGDSLKVTINFINRSKVPVRKIRVEYFDTTLVLPEELGFNQVKTITINRITKKSPLADQPYWLKEQMSEGSFTVKDQQLIGLPENKEEDIELIALIGNAYIKQTLPLQYRYVDPVKGEIYQPVITVPAMLVNIFPGVVLTNVIPKAKPLIEVRYQSQGDYKPTEAQVVLANGEQLFATKATIVREKYKNQSLYYPVDSVIKVKKNAELFPSFVFNEKGQKETSGNYLRMINYDHVPTVHYLFQPKLKVVTDEIKVVGKRIGYIKGAGDNVPDALTAMGYEVMILESSDITAARLKTLDAVITGVRAYNVHEYLSDKYDALMEYVKNGGNLIVQYNTSSQIGPIRAKISPYPFDITRTRVTDEKAVVTVLKPQHAVLNFPNKIGEKDFAGWIQERSIYHAGNLDSHYETIFSMNDPGEKTYAGSLIIAQYGKGFFTYTGLVFFRELPAGVPGAYRLLANLIALNYKKGF